VSGHLKRANWWRAQIAAAPTPGDLFATAARWLRAIAADLPDERRRDEVLVQTAHDVASKADALAREMTHER
jgi:hypothetical protein